MSAQIVKRVPAFNRQYLMIQYSLDGKTFWRCRHITHPDAKEKAA